MAQLESMRDKSLTESQFSRRLAGDEDSAGQPRRVRVAARVFSKIDLLPKALGLGAEAFFLDQPGCAGSGTASPLAAKL